MYQIYGAVVKIKDQINDYVILSKEETEAVICSNIFDFCSEFILNLLNTFTPERLSLKLTLIKDNLITNNISLLDYITNNGNNALPTEKGFYDIKDGVVKYSDGVRAKYKAIPTNRTIHHTVNILNEHKTDILLQKDNIDYTEFYKNCLVSVNGFFHFTELDPTEGIFVLNGNKSRQLCNNNVFGIYSFSELGNIRLLPIQQNMIRKLNNKTFLSEGITIKLDEDITDKSILLIIGGYQYIIDQKTIQYLSEDCILVSPKEMFLVEKYHESKEYIDLSTLPLFKNPRSKSQVSISEIYSDENLIKYFTLPEYSFVVIIDTKEISTENITIRKTHCPGLYISYEYPQYPIYNGLGKCVNYLFEEDEGQWAIKCIDSYYHDRQYDTVILKDQKTVGNNRLTQKPINQSIAYMQKIKYTSFVKI